MTAHEEKLIQAYRRQPDTHKAIDKLLGVNPDSRDNRINATTETHTIAKIVCPVVRNGKIFVFVIYPNGVDYYMRYQ